MPSRSTSQHVVARHLTSGLALLLLASLPVEPLQAQSEGGTCAGVQGAVEVQHGGAWQEARVGTAVAVGDQLRTGPHSRATIVFRDDSVFNLAPNTVLGVESQESGESAHRRPSLLGLATGKVRAWVSAADTARAQYEVETPTAVISARGGEFIVSYDGANDATDVVGLEGKIDVHSKLAVMGSGVEVGPHFLTRVPKRKFPAQPQRLSAARLPQYLEGVDLVGTGRRDGLNVLHPAVVGRILAPQDVPGPGAASSAGAGETGALALTAPLPGSVADTLSPDVYTNTQPLRDYQQTPPGQAPSGSVHVGF